MQRPEAKRADDAPFVGDMTEMLATLPAFKEKLTAVKRSLTGMPFYPYDALGNVVHFDRLLHGEHRRLGRLAGGLPVADIGGADGDLAFFLAHNGFHVHVVDNSATNTNGLRVARAVAEKMGTGVTVHDVDLDARFALPEAEYGLVCFLGILYHLKNPFNALEKLAQQSRWMLLSTRIAQWARPLQPAPVLDERRALAESLVDRFLPKPGIVADMVRIAELPVAYLVESDECNDDPTNYWIFTALALKRMLQRAGWDIAEFMTVGDTEWSDPASYAGDERAFVLAKSRVRTG